MSDQKDFAAVLNLTREICEPCRQWSDFDRLLQALSQAVPDFIEQWKNAPVGKGSRIFFGAGGHGRYLLKACRAIGAEPDYFCDNDHQAWTWMGNSAKKQHTRVDGVYVLKPEELGDLDNPQAVIATNISSFRRAIKEQLRSLGVPLVPGPEGYLYEAVIMNSHLKFYRQHLDELKAVYDFLDDGHSRFIYLSVLKARLIPYEASEACYSAIREGGHYWPFAAFKNLKDVAFVDAGAGDGDTVKSFLNNNAAAGFQRIHAFEPDDVLFGRLSRNAVNLGERFQFGPEKIALVKAGLGCAEKGLAPSARLQRAIETDPLSMPPTRLLPPCEPTYALDDYLDGRPAGFIKADVEGFELDMIQGAARSISAFRPHLAVSIYHLPVDIFAVPLAIKALVPEYKMAVRHHTADLFDTVLYCWL